MSNAKGISLHVAREISPGKVWMILSSAGEMSADWTLYAPRGLESVQVAKEVYHQSVKEVLYARDETVDSYKKLVLDYPSSGFEGRSKINLFQFEKDPTCIIVSPGQPNKYGHRLEELEGMSIAELIVLTQSELPLLLDGDIDRVRELIQPEWDKALLHIFADSRRRLVTDEFDE